MSNASTATDSTDDAQSNESSSQEARSRSIAKRVFASELTDATFTVKFEDSENAPKYQVLPSGEVANRVAVAGVLTDVSSVNDSMLSARVCDPTGSIQCYAGQYQPEARSDLEALSAPEHVMVVGKVSSFDPEDGETLISITIEEIQVIPEEDKERWVAETLEQTSDRLNALEQGEAPHGDLANERYPDGVSDALTQHLIDAGDHLEL